jgi:hypothetical protein
MAFYYKLVHAFTGAVAVAMVVAAFPAALSAQWPSYPTPGVPRTSSGQPNLDGPTPRTADGKPDLSGIWDARPMRAGQRGQNAGKNPPAAPRQAGPPAGGGPGRSQFFNIGSTLKDGLPFQPWAADLRKQRMADNNKDNPDAHCLPLGLMQLHLHPQPRKIIQTPGVIVILYEAQGGVRQIFTDGRPLPNDDPQPWWYGYSIGKWDGDTLVVTTTGFRDDVWLDVEGSPLTSAGKMIERFRRPDYGHLDIEVTVDDPKAYTKPWTVIIHQRIMPDTELIEFVCQENEKSDAHLVGK